MCVYYRSHNSQQSPTRWRSCFFLSLCFPQRYLGELLLSLKRCGFDPWVGKIPWRRKWHPTPVFLPGKFYGQRNLEGYSPWGQKESDMTEQLTTQATKTMEICYHNSSLLRHRWNPRSSRDWLSLGKGQSCMSGELGDEEFAEMMYKGFMVIKKKDWGQI